MDWLKSKGHIKEATEADMIPLTDTNLADSALIIYEICRDSSRNS